MLRVGSAYRQELCETNLALVIYPRELGRGRPGMRVDEDDGEIFARCYLAEMCDIVRLQFRAQGAATYIPFIVGIFDAGDDESLEVVWQNYTGRKEDRTPLGFSTYEFADNPADVPILKSKLDHRGGFNR
jgi:hypothetical protein